MLKKLSLFKKTNLANNTYYSFLGLPIFSIKYATDLSKYNLCLLGLPIIAVRPNTISTRYRFLFFSWKKYHNQLTKKIFKQVATERPNLLWWDHALGGGTEYYFLNQKERIIPQNNILRIQYIPNEKCYQITLFTLQGIYSKPCFSFKQLQHVLKTLPFQQIVVNNLVSYPDLFSSLQFITQLHTDQQIPVSFRLHDFNVLCPFSYNLMRGDCFCQGPAERICKKCTYVQHKPQQWQSWRLTWGNFLVHTVSEIIVFSQASRELLLQAYPLLSSKIKVIPHDVPPLRKVHISPHKDLVISVLGIINNAAKGMKILQELENELKAYPDIHLTVIGVYQPLSPATCVTGTYQRKNLPDLLEKYQTDVIFIPSICPETFSYTTSEAIYTGLPVACFNIGAQAEKIKAYSKGLIISNPDAKTALQQINQFIQRKYTYGNRSV